MSPLAPRPPGGPAALPGDGGSDRRPRPRPLVPRAYRFPKPERVTLENGLRLLVSTRPQLPLVSLLVGVEVGASADPPGAEGLAYMTARLLSEGAGSRTAAEVAEEAEQLGATLEANASWDLTAIRLATVGSNLDAALALVADVAFRPRFDPAEVQRETSQRLAEIVSDRDNPRHVAAERGARFVYGAHRYGAQLAGDETSIQRLSAERLRAFHGERHRADASFLVLVGDVTPERGAELARRHLGPWPAGAPPRVPTPEPEPLGPTVICLVDQPGAAQSEIRVSQPGVPRTDPDYFRLLVMNAVLGEAFGSRLYFNLREKHGYTYGVSSYFSMRRGRGPFVAGAGVHTPVTDKAVAEFLRELRDICRVPPTRRELRDAKGFLAGGLAVELQSNGSVADRIAEGEMYGLPDDYMHAYRDRIYAVTAEEVQAAAGRVLRPENMVVTVVGDAAEVQAKLAALRPTQVFDALGNPK